MNSTPTRVTKRQSRNQYSLLAIQMLSHFHATLVPYLPGAVDTWPPSQQNVVAAFLQAGLITPAPHGFDTTEKGARLVRRLKLAFESLMVEAGA